MSSAVDPVGLILGAAAGVLSGVFGLLFWVARLVYTGRLVPASTLDRERRSGEAWREAYLAEAARNRELTGQVGTVVTAVREAVTP